MIELIKNLAAGLLFFGIFAAILFIWVGVPTLIWGHEDQTSWPWFVWVFTPVAAILLFVTVTAGQLVRDVWRSS